MDWKQLLASITGSVDEELRLRNAYLAAENRILRNQMKARRLLLTDAERKTLAEIGHKLGRQALQEIATIAKPDTILAWHRKCTDHQDVSAPQRPSVGRPRIAKELEDLVVRMARENRSWGYDRIVGALLNLGYRISGQTVGNILKRHGIPPAPERKTTTTWQEFLCIHRDVLMATDFFSSVVWGWWGRVLSCLLRWICLARAQACGVGMTLYHQGRRMRLILRQALNGHTAGQSSVQAVKQYARRQMILCGAGVLETPVATSTCSEKRQSHTQHRAQAVCVSTASHRQIRDGPRRRQPWRDGLWHNDAREAA
jgi:putative transposase